MIIFLLYLQAVEQGLHIGIGAVRSDRSFGGAGEGEEKCHLVGNGAGIVGRLAEGFGTEMNRLRFEMKRAEIASRNDDGRGLGEDGAPGGGSGCGGIDARHYPRQTSQLNVFEVLP